MNCRPTILMAHGVTVSLRGTLSLVAAAFLVLAVGVSVSMVEVSTYQHENARKMARAFEKVRLTGDLRVDLLRAQQVQTVAEQASLEQDIQIKLDMLSIFISSPEGHQLASQVKHSIARYLRQGPPNGHGVGGSGAGDLSNAKWALDRLISISENQVAAQLAASARWDRMGDYIGWSTASVLVAGVLALILWLWFWAFRPVFGVAVTMRDFAAGNHQARVPERGYSEVQSIARGFNDMAQALLDQQDRQLTLMAAVAHDLRSPLGAIKLTASLLQQKPFSSEERLRKLNLIERQALRIDRLVGDFLDRARIEAGQLELKCQPCDLRELSRASVELFAQASAAHPVLLDCPEQPIMACCDRGRMEQVLNNLLSNAIKYSPGGGIIRVTLRSENQWAVVLVTDHGMGISEADQQVIFQPYRRVGRERENISGVGLGLYVSRWIVEAHGGEVTVKSAPAKGSIFRVSIPLLVFPDSLPSVDSDQA